MNVVGTPSNERNGIVPNDKSGSLQDTAPFANPSTPTIADRDVL